MPTSALRIVVLAAFVASGLLLIDRGFAGADGEIAIQPTAGPTEPAATQTPTPSASASNSNQTPPFDGLRFKVNNGTSLVGLAAATTEKISARYSGRMSEGEPGDVSDIAVTTIYYGPGFEAQAQWLMMDFFGTLARVTATLQPLDATSPDFQDYDLVIQLGADYAASDYVKNVLGLE